MYLDYKVENITKRQKVLSFIQAEFHINKNESAYFGCAIIHQMHYLLSIHVDNERYILLCFIASIKQGQRSDILNPKGLHAKFAVNFGFA
jgi:hypothetical protein